MASAEGFLKAIAATPDDDVVRLVFADWLEDRGDPRAELMRLTVQLARLPESDPRYRTIAEEVRRLHARDADTWLGACRAAVIEWEVRRGLLRLHVSAVSLAEAGPAVAEFVEHLRPDGPTEGVIRLLRHPRLAVLSSLDLSDREMGDHTLRRLLYSARPERLTRLDLRRNAITDIGAEILLASRNLGRLSLLDLRYNHITGTILNDLLARFGPALRL